MTFQQNLIILSQKINSLFCGRPLANQSLNGSALGDGIV